MRATLRHAAWLTAALAILVLALSAESCGDNGTTVSTSGGTKTISITDRASNVSVLAGTAQHATASCQAGEVMLSGGYEINPIAYKFALNPNDPLTRYFVFADYPDSTSSWNVGVLNRASGDEAGDILLTAHVECASGLSGAPTIAGGIGTLDGGLAVCPNAGMTLTGGGYQVSPDPTGNAVLSINTSTDHPSTPGGTISSSWVVDASIPKGASVPDKTVVYAYGVCGSRDTMEGFNASVTAPSASLTLVTTSGEGSANCQSGQILTGAGFKLAKTDGSLTMTSFYPDYRPTLPQWDTTLYSLPQASFIPGIFESVGGSATVIPLCMTVG